MTAGGPAPPTDSGTLSSIINAWPIYVVDGAAHLTYTAEMPRFYFDLHECGHGPLIDKEGQELVDVHAASAQAIRSAREVMASEVVEGRLCLGCAIVVRDELGADVLAVPFVEALTVTMVGDC